MGAMRWQPPNAGCPRCAAQSRSGSSTGAALAQHWRSTGAALAQAAASHTRIDGVQPIQVAAEPRGQAVSPQGHRHHVAHSLGSQLRQLAHRPRRLQPRLSPCARRSGVGSAQTWRQQQLLAEACIPACQPYRKHDHQAGRQRCPPTRGDGKDEGAGQGSGADAQGNLQPPVKESLVLH